VIRLAAAVEELPRGPLKARNVPGTKSRRTLREGGDLATQGGKPAGENRPVGERPRHLGDGADGGGEDSPCLGELGCRESEAFGLHVGAGSTDRAPGGFGAGLAKFLQLGHIFGAGYFRGR